ncbi:hypothetical protein GCM10027280_45400 [Micromonospora polyrhachis]|uniref:Uncharacterized protein n=1 Tax=Micromonospora polyrhachis TaxID=1282883 RepID=A0A7W7SQZ9_9ACTN|nr:hypothetical protein [Micromonospora polyrhachis]MBB4958946.1 hypothetical protein [Micromonospora polyrhachis]
MADQLASPQDLASLLGLVWADLDAGQQASLTMLVEVGTAVVQAEPRQRLVAVADDSITLLGDTGSWLWLPQRPVTAVTSVTLDGEPISDWQRFGSRLWRAGGWAAGAYRPSTVAVVYSHGYAPDAQGLQLARGAVLAVVRDWAANPSAATSLKIDDYAETYSAIAARFEASTHLRTALRRQYGQRGGLAKIGGG